MTASNIRATQLVLHGTSQELEVAFDDNAVFRIPFELLRVYSPSAEVQGHSPEQAVLQSGKRGVDIVGVEPIGHYAIKPSFSDGHDSGLFTWAYLYHLGQNQAQLWSDYEAKLLAAGRSRDEAMPVKPASGCASHA